MSAWKRQKLPGLQIDSIDLGSPYLKRVNKVNETLELASTATRVVVGGSPCTEKSSLLELLAEKVVEAVKSMSRRILLSISRDRGKIPKGAVFQQLFYEAANKLLPSMHMLIPELNTKAKINGKVVTDELDFSINSNLKWAIELLVEGRGVGEHLPRFAGNGKYREVDTQAYLVVDFRGPRVRQDVIPNSNRCTFYFADDFSSCVCQLRLADEITFNLPP